MIFDKKNLDTNTLLAFYKALLWPRTIEEKMLILLRQGRIGKWFSGIGQEAIAVGATLAMQKDEYILPMHRNLGVFTTRGMSLTKLMAQWQGKETGFTKGRDRSFHFGSQEHKIIGMISHLGPQMALADGIALADLLSKRKKATLVFTGEGATSQGDFHEAVNIAAVWNLPVIFLIENNGYALSTPTNEQYKTTSLAGKAAGYGIEGRVVDGNNVLDVYHTVKELAESMRRDPRPVILECITFRMRGHEEASGVKYVPPQLIADWAAKDPVKNFEDYLIREGILREDWVPYLKNEFGPAIEQQVEAAFKELEPTPDAEREAADMYKPFALPAVKPPSHYANKRFIDAISDALRMSMYKYPNLVLMGQDIAEYGGAFKITEGFVEVFGRGRVRNTPLCESAVVGAAMGLSLNGYKAVMEMQFADFVSTGFNQIVNNLAKTYYRWEQNVDVVIRMPTGAGTGAGPFHSQSNEAWFTKTPGLKVVYPAFPADAKGLLMAAIADPNPVMYFEHKYLYRSITGDVPDDDYYIEIGKANIVKQGSRATIITYGLGVHWALEYTDKHPDLSIELVDLRSLQPWDKETVEASVRKTGRALILHEDTLTSGFGAEIAAHIAEHCFSSLDAPVMRCASLDTAIPMSRALEDDFLAKARLEEAMGRLLGY
ncbi:alpha-ketoacid dehydrogenase subunit alpha/beta [Mucilaginibacter myungsuensis]|uniref:Dehydrogenase E1 component subunit alpha/beta n=1 Tax=Mucilaginibacter myungsuensis TaxID=649104 RepID=A0A929PY56_9SPHI|nr:dehydrogenase E1 component subunit alpha/beta [Mucilaginibacter myungsuensis]MBE9663829.1 dehydrogenase E1 component subunit alpha/beta [Mucilaginibacter myungsuensis]MDN3598456.1 dehydrogenase E1 component subunit alpha/beta [Mucilaginibacter myungsuensis]